MHLLDANVLIAMTIEEGARHRRGSTWPATVDRIAECPVVEGALVRFLIRIGGSIDSAQQVLAGCAAALAVRSGQMGCPTPRPT